MERSNLDFALCLSGGGFRAALFHLGSLRRLNELGILSQVDVVSSVSGGSMLASHLASHMRAAESHGVPWPAPGDVWPAFDTMAAAFHDKLSRHLPIATLLSFDEVIVQKLPRGLKKWVGGMKLSELPNRPEFIFNATELQTGRVWSFSRTEIGSDQLGYSEMFGHALVAEAVAASACFPLFEPLRARFRSIDFHGAVDARPVGDWDILFTDGGVFDNLGLEKVASAKTLLVSDGGKDAAPLTPPRSASNRREPIPSMATPARNQLEALRWILSSASRDSNAPRLRLEELSRRMQFKEVKGAYWCIGDGIDATEGELPPGYSAALAGSHIATIRTQLDAFSAAERQVLDNHGYVNAERAIRTEAEDLVRADDVLKIPWPEALSEDFVRKKLRHSKNISSGIRAIKGWLSR